MSRVIVSAPSRSSSSNLPETGGKVACFCRRLRDDRSRIERAHESTDGVAVAHGRSRGSSIELEIEDYASEQVVLPPGTEPFRIFAGGIASDLGGYAAPPNLVCDFPCLDVTGVIGCVSPVVRYVVQ